MFKFCISIITLSLCNYVFSGVVTENLTRQELQELEVKTMSECKKEFNIDETIYAKFFNSSSSVTPTQELKCMLNRYGEKMGFVKNNKTDWETIVLVEKIYHDVVDERRKALEAVENCRKTVVEGSDLCENSFQVAKCLQDEYRKGCIGGC